MSQAQYYPPPPTTNGNLAYLPYQQPQYYSQPAPQQDPLEQLAKTVRLLDYIKGRESAGAPAQVPAQQQQVSQFGTPGAGSVAQFAPYSQQVLDQQQQAMGLAQASAVSAQPNSQPWQQVWGQNQATNNLEAQQKQCINQLVNTLISLDNEIGAWVKLSGDLVHILEINLMLNQEIEMLDKLVYSLLPFIQAAQIWAKDSFEHEAALNSVLELLLSPGYLVYHAFELWKNMPLTDFDLDTISEQFLQLIQVHKPQQGTFVPQPSMTPYFMPGQQPQSASGVPFPPVPSTSGTQNNGGIYAVIEALRNPQGADTARSLVRARNAGMI